MERTIYYSTGSIIFLKQDGGTSCWGLFKHVSQKKGMVSCWSAYMNKCAFFLTCKRKFTFTFSLCRFISANPLISMLLTFEHALGKMYGALFRVSGIGNQSTWRKPMQTHGEHTNPTFQVGSKHITFLSWGDRANRWATALPMSKSFAFIYPLFVHLICMLSHLPTLFFLALWAHCKILKARASGDSRDEKTTEK